MTKRHQKSPDRDLLRLVFGPGAFEGVTKVQRLPCNGVSAGPQEWVTSADGIASFGAAHDRDRGTLAYCPAVFSSDEDSEANLRESRALVLDFDGKDGLDNPSRILTDDALQAQGVTDAVVRFNRSEKLLGNATALVFTGYGVHGVWVFAQPLPVDDANRPHLKRVWKKIATAAGADRTAATLNHYFRIPGTRNWKGATPRMAQVVALRPQYRLRVQDLFAVTSKIEEPAEARESARVRDVLRHGAESGNRHNALVKVAAHAHHSGLNGDALLAHLQAANEKLRPPSPSSEVEAIVRYYDSPMDEGEADGDSPTASIPGRFDGAPIRALGGFVVEYVSYAEAQTDAPVVFHYASILPVLAAAIADVVEIDVAPRRKPIVFNSVCVGRSRRTRKTTATEMATGILVRVFPDRITPSDFSPEALIDQIAEHPASLLALNEAGLLLARGSSDYGKALLPMLCTLADAPPRYSRRTRKEKDPIVVERPALSMLAGSNEALLGQHLRPIDVQSGLVPRWLLVFAEDRERTAKIQPRADEERANDLAVILRNVRENAPQFVWFSDAAQGRLGDWANGAEELIPPDLDALVGGAEDVARKTAALLHVSRGGLGEVGLEEMEAALQLAQYGLDSAVWVTSRHLADNRATATLNRVREAIRQSMPMGITRRALLRTLHILVQDLTRYIETLRATGEVLERAVGRTTRFFLRDTRHLSRPAGPAEVSPVAECRPSESGEDRG